MRSRNLRVECGSRAVMLNTVLYKILLLGPKNQESSRNQHERLLIEMGIGADDSSWLDRPPSPLSPFSIPSTPSSFLPCIFLPSPYLTHQTNIKVFEVQDVNEQDS